MKIQGKLFQIFLYYKLQGEKWKYIEVGSNNSLLLVLKSTMKVQRSCVK